MVSHTFGPSSQHIDRLAAYWAEAIHRGELVLYDPLSRGSGARMRQTASDGGKQEQRRKANSLYKALSFVMNTTR